MICVNKKIVLAGGILVGVLFILLIVASITPSDQKTASPASSSRTAESAKVALNHLTQSQSGKKEIPQLNNDQIATLLLQWANNTRTDKGGYASGEDCDGEGVCQSLVVNNSVGAPAIWARYQYYLKHHNMEAAEIIRQDLKTYNDPTKVTTIQPYFWNCKLIYELWKNDFFNQDEKDELQVICARALYTEIDNSPRSLSPTTEDVVKEVNANLASDKSGSFFGSKLRADKLDEYAFNASERASMYVWAQDPTDMKQAKLYFIAAMETLSGATDVTVAADEASMVGLAALDLNTIMPAKELPLYAKEVYTRYKDKSCSTLQSCVMRAYFYNELYKLDKNTEYKAERDRVIADLYSNKFDYQGTNGYFAGKQAFYDHGLNYYYDMIPNTMLAGLLLTID